MIELAVDSLVIDFYLLSLSRSLSFSCDNFVTDQFFRSNWMWIILPSIIEWRHTCARGYKNMKRSRRERSSITRGEKNVSALLTYGFIVSLTLIFRWLFLLDWVSSVPGEGAHLLNWLLHFEWEQATSIRRGKTITKSICSQRRRSKEAGLDIKYNLGTLLLGYLVSWCNSSLRT